MTREESDHYDAVGLAALIRPGAGSAPAALATALDDAMRLDHADLRAMGSRGRNWIQRDFSWKEIGGMTLRTYEWLRGGGPAPPWVDRRR